MPHNSQDDVGVESIDFQLMDKQWQKVRDLKGGTDAMRCKALSGVYLQKEPAEEDDAYSRRVERSYLYNGFADTVDKLSSKPFSKPVSITGDMPPKTAKLADNADMTGQTLSQFAAQVFEDAVSNGKSHILVDAPPNTGEMSLRDEKALDLRTFLVHIKADQLIGWRFEKDQFSRKRLAQVRIREVTQEPDGNYAEKQVERIRVINAPTGDEQGTWELWERDLNEGDTHSNQNLNDQSGSAGDSTTSHGTEYTQTASGTHGFAEIPLLTIYTNRIEEFVAEPPLSDLIDVNLAHWQSNSAQRNVSWYSRMALLFASGFQEEDLKKVVIAPNALISSTDPEADLKYVEYNGNAVEAGERDLERMEAQMATLGAQPLTERSVGATATGLMIDEGRTHSDMQLWVTATELVLERAYMIAALGNNEKLPPDFSIDIFSEFNLSKHAAEDIKVLIQARASGDITHLTFLKELQRRGLLNAAVDLEKEIELALAEGPRLDNIEPFNNAELGIDDDPVEE